jgi:YggT family protein
MTDALMISTITVLLGVLNLYKWVIIIQALLSWIQPDPSNPIVQILNRLAEPAYTLVRRYIPTNFGGIDITPLVIIFAIIFVETFITSLF